jgi:hypothetical protein
MHGVGVPCMGMHGRGMPGIAVVGEGVQKNVIFLQKYKLSWLANSRET